MTLEEWVAMSSDSHRRFMEHFTLDARQVEAWISELTEFQKIVDFLAERFQSDEDEREFFLDAGWEMARLSIVSGRPIAAPVQRDQVQDWGIALWERLHQYYGILILDIEGWLAACQQACDVKQPSQES